MRLHSNAPSSWPAFEMDAWDVHRSAPNIEPLAEAFDRAFVAASITRPILLYVPRLFGGGFLPVPFEIVEATGNVAVFPYPNDSMECAGHYAAARRLLKERGVEAVYFAPAPLPEDAPPVAPLRPFDPNYLGPGQGPRPQGRFGMWWAEQAIHGRFSASETFQYFDRIYTAMDGIESYVFGELLHSLRILPVRQRVQLPKEMAPLHITGPDLRDMFFSATAEKGIRFRFTLDTPPWYRDTFWRLLCAYVEELAVTAKQEQWPLDPEESRKTRQWWTFFKQSLPQVEAQAEQFIFGILVTGESAQDA